MAGAGRERLSNHPTLTGLIYRRYSCLSIERGLSAKLVKLVAAKAATTASYWEVP